MIFALIDIIAVTMALAVWGRFDYFGSVAKETSTWLDWTDVRSLKSGTYKNRFGGLRRWFNCFRFNFELAWIIWKAWAKALAVGILIFLIIFVITLCFKWLLANSASSVTGTDIIAHTKNLLFGAIDAITFDTFVLFGLDHDLIGKSFSERAINFTFLLSTALIFSGLLVGLIRNLISTIIGMVFAESFVNAANPKKKWADNTAFEKFIYYALDFEDE